MSSWLVLVARGLALGCLWLEFGAHLAPFGLPLGPLGGPMGSRGAPLGVPRGSLGGPLGIPWASLGVPWGSLVDPLGCPGGALGCLGRCRGHFFQICQKLDAQFRANVSNVPRLRIESSLPSFARVAWPARGNGSQSAAQTPPSTRAGGQDDVSLKETPSN